MSGEHLDPDLVVALIGRQGSLPPSDRALQGFPVAPSPPCPLMPRVGRSPMLSIPTLGSMVGLVSAIGTLRGCVCV